jgi:glycopeptide antibiotics resistance protein
MRGSLIKAPTLGRGLCYNETMIKSTTVIFLLAALSLMMAHLLALEFFLYWRYLWLDMPIHVLGGMVAALGYLSARDFLPSLPPRYFSLWMTLAFVLAVAVTWEIFEVRIGIIFEEVDYVLDTIIDLCLGLCGGAIGYLARPSRDRNL